MWFSLGTFVNVWCLLMGVPQASSVHNYSGTLTTFLGAVVDYPLTPIEGAPEKVAQQRAASYGLYAWHAATIGADIIVFPGNALHGNFNERVPVRVPPVGSDLCQNNATDQGILETLSCVAYAASIYLVASIDEEIGNKTCNALVVFNNEGVLIARHREPGCPHSGNDQYFIFHPYELKIGLLLPEDLLYSCDFYRRPLLSHYILPLGLENDANRERNWLVQLTLWLSESFVIVSNLRRNEELQSTRAGIYWRSRAIQCSPLDDLMIARIPTNMTELISCVPH